MEPNNKNVDLVDHLSLCISSWLLHNHQTCLRPDALHFPYHHCPLVLHPRLLSLSAAITSNSSLDDQSLKHVCWNSSNVVVTWTDEQHLLAWVKIKHKLCLSVPLKDPLLLLQWSFWAQEMEEKLPASNYNTRTTSGPGPAVSSAWTFCGVTSMGVKWQRGRDLWDGSALQLKGHNCLISSS